MTQSIEILIKDILSLVQVGKAEAALGTPARSLTPEAKSNALMLAKAIIADVRGAAAEVSNLSDDKRDELSLKIGDDLFRVLGGQQ